MRDGKINPNRKNAYDSEDVNLNLENEFDRWNRQKRQVKHVIEEKYNPYLLGFGFPLRTPSYILGAKKKWVN